MFKKILLFCFFLSNTISSQNIDNTFNPLETNEYDQNYGGFNYNFSLNGVIFKDGSALIPKKVDNLYDQQTLVKIDGTGKKDSAFYLDYTLYNGLIDNSMRVFANQTSKKFVIVTSDNVIRYFNANGSLISTFVSPVFLNTLNSNPVEINKILVQNDDKFLVVGFFNKVNNLDYKNIVRLNADGSIDTTFNIGTGLNGKAKSVAIQTDNKYVVVGEFSQYNGIARYFIVRINSNGSNDDFFSVNRTFSSQSTTGVSYGFEENNLKDVLIQSDGKIITVGPGFVSNFNIVSRGLTRFNSNGTRDTSFSVFTNGNYPTSADIQTDGKIITNNITSNGRPCRLNSNGSNDTSFVANNSFGQPEYKVISVTGNKVMVFGDYTKLESSNQSGITRREIHRLNTNGTIDLTYKPQSGFNIVKLYQNASYNYNIVNQVEILPTNNLIIKGQFTSYNDAVAMNVVKTNQNGVVDSSFSLPNTVNLEAIKDGKIFKANHTDDKFYLIKGGQLSLINNDNRTLLKFNENGSLDNTFAPFYGSIDRLIITIDNKLILSGSGSNFQTGSQYKLVKLNENGTVDSSFNSHLFNSTPYAIDFQLNGKIIVISGGGICRLNTDGSMDTTFTLPVVYNVNDLVVAPDDKIYYTKTATWSYNKLNCLLPNGAFNTSFPEMINCSLPKFIENSRLLIYDGQGDYGPFDTYLIKNYNGVTLNTFQIKDEYNNPITSSHVVQNCNNLLIYGAFVNANNQYNAGIIRYNLNNFVSTPTPVANTYQTFTAGQTLNDLVVNGQNLTWYATQSSCTESSLFKNSNTISSFVPNTTSLVDGTTYFVSQTINGVESNHRLPIKVTQTLSSSSFEKLDFKLFPNPANDIISIETDFQFEKIKIFNNIGQLVFESNYKNDKQYNLSQLTKGFYNVLILDENNKKLSSKKLIKN